MTEIQPFCCFYEECLLSYRIQIFKILRGIYRNWFLALKFCTVLCIDINNRKTLCANNFFDKSAFWDGLIKVVIQFHDFLSLGFIWNIQKDLQFYLHQIYFYGNSKFNSQAFHIQKFLNMSDIAKKIRKIQFIIFCSPGLLLRDKCLNFSVDILIIYRKWDILKCCKKK